MASKKLEVLRYEACAATVLNGDVVDAVCVQYEHAGMAGYGIFAEHTGVIEL